MSQETFPSSTRRGSWRTHLLITGGVLLTVFLALILAELDGLQRQILPSPIAEAISNLNATPTSTPLPAIPLASGTPTPPGATPGTASNGILPSCPATPANWVLTNISENDSLLSLSVRFNISAETIRLANCLPSDSLVTVSALYLPNPAMTPTATPLCGRPPSNWVLTTILRGQTLFRLSQIYGVSVNQIVQANCLTSVTLYAGQPIYLPWRNVQPPTAIPSPTASATPTATNTATATATSTGTTTSTPTSTVPPLPTASATSSPTATATATGTPTPTTTASSTPTASHTPTPSATPTASVTPTASPTSTPSATPTATLSPTASHTPTPSATPTNTATSTATASPTPSATPTNTVTPTPTATATP